MMGKMAEWHHGPNRHEFGQALGDGEDEGAGMLQSMVGKCRTALGD